MREVVRSTAFRKDVKRVQKRGYAMELLKAIIVRLLTGEPLPESFKDHPLKGKWIGYRDVHIEPDWVLIYRLTEAELLLARTGTHSDLFGK